SLIGKLRRSGHITNRWKQPILDERPQQHIGTESIWMRCYLSFQIRRALDLVADGQVAAAGANATAARAIHIEERHRIVARHDLGCVTETLHGLAGGAS